MPPGRRDHYLPAAYLGRFSNITTRRARKRPLHVADRRATSTFVQSAENIACRPGLYDLPEPDTDWLGDHIDLWGYEAGLPAALDQLCAETISLDADVWLHNLVPFVAGLFSRGPDLNGGQNNAMRLMAFQEMLAPVMVSQWTILHYPAGSVMTNDRALAIIDTPFGSGTAVPLDTASVLLLTRCTARQVATHQAGGWYTSVKHHNMNANDAHGLRDALARYAMNAIVGPTEEAVAGGLGILGTDTVPRGGETPRARSDEGRHSSWAVDDGVGGWWKTTAPGLIVNPNDCDLACHLYDFFRVASAIRVGREEAQAAADRIDLDALLPAWRSPIAVQFNFTERTRGGVTVLGGTSLNLSLELGLNLCERRRAVGDYRRGGFSIMPFDHLRAQTVSLGDMCRQGADGRAHRTYLQNLKTGKVTKVDLRPSSRGNQMTSRKL